MKLDRYTQKAQEAILTAQQLATSQQSPVLDVEHLLAALANPCPSHKVRSEFLATMCFAHLMSHEQIETVLDNRVKEMMDYLQLFKEFETDCMDDWPPGARFVLGFGQTMMKTMRAYIEDNRNLLFEDKDAEQKTAVG